MNPTSTIRFRRTTAVFALLWSLFAIVLSMGPLRVPSGGVQHPMRVSVLGGSVIVEGLGPSLAETEVAPGDRLLELNGRPFLLEYRRGPGWLQAGVPNTYRLEKRDGRRYSVELLPAPMEAAAWCGGSGAIAPAPGRCCSSARPCPCSSRRRSRET
jgi:hypothetical protein